MIYNLVVNTYEDENLLFSLNTIGSITDNILKYSDEDNEIQISLKKALFNGFPVDLRTVYEWHLVHGMPFFGGVEKSVSILFAYIHFE